MAETAMDPAETMKKVGSHWGLILTLGIVTTLLGIGVATRPVTAGGVIALLVGLQVLIAGIIRLVMSFSSEGEGHRVWWIILGVLSIAIGAFLIRNPVDTFVITVMVIGILWMVQGIMEFFAAASEPSGTKGRGWEFFLGFVGFIAGIILLVSPISMGLTLVWIIGIWMIFYGVVTIFGAFQVKKAAAA